MKNRIVFIDYIRVIACFMVMMVHVTEMFYVFDTSGAGENMVYITTDANRFWMAFWNGAVSRICVPLFMIASAFLLAPLSKETSMLQFYKKRFLRIGPPLIIFMILYSILPSLLGQVSWEQGLNALIHIPLNFPENAGHLWFMYPLISLYLIIPIISPWLERASAKDELIFLSIFAITTFIPFIHKLTPNTYIFGECWWNNFNMFWYCSGYIGYLVMAHYIQNHMKWSVRKRLLIGGIALLVGCSYTFYSHYSKTAVGVPLSLPLIEYAWEFCTPNLLVSSFGAFTMFTCIKKPKTPLVVVDISKLSFGMYLMHLFYLVPITQFFINGDTANPILPVWLTIPLATLLCYVCCYITSKLISYLPGSKYLIG